MIYCFQKDISRIFSSSFTIVNISDIKFHETNYFAVHISKTRLKIEDLEVGCVCIILSKHTKTKTVRQRGEKKRKKSVWVKLWLENRHQMRRNFSLVAGYSLKFTRCLLLVAEIHPLLFGKFARYSLQKFLVAKNNLWLIAKFACYSL